MRIIFNNLTVDNDSLEKMTNYALTFLSRYVNCKIVETDIGYDILSANNIELGSYGIREYKDKKWIYGTGLAEPRLSKVKK